LKGIILIIHSTTAKVFNLDSDETLLSNFDFSDIDETILTRLKAVIIKYKDAFLDATKKNRNFALKQLELKLKSELDNEQKEKPQQSLNLESDQENFKEMDKKITTRQVRFAENTPERLFASPI
jgi:hypothetical protein